MSRIVRELLAAKEPEFSQLIGKLERASGHPSADVRLTAELLAGARVKSRSLDLDARDTRGAELYHALLERASQHNKLLSESLGGVETDDGQDTILRTQAVIHKLGLPDTCWALKRTAAKRLLKNRPPKHLMKHLGYRSIDSMLKRENIAELYGALCFLESDQWLKRFIGDYKNVQSNDFESRTIEVIQLSRDKWGDQALDYANRQRSNLVGIRVLGVIAVLPFPAAKMQGLMLTMTALITYYMQQIRMFSVYCKLQQVKADFGALAGRALNGQTGFAAELAGSSLPWPVLLQHFGSVSKRRQADVFTPHVQPDDLSWRSVSVVLEAIHKDLGFWRGTDYLGVLCPDGIVSCNLLDVTLNYCNNVAYQSRSVYYMREALWYELYARYLAQEVLEQDVLKQLESNMLTAI